MGSHFKPAWWLPNPHLQTLWGSFCRRLPELPRKRQRLWLKDGDFIDLDWHESQQTADRLVLIVHGLTGSSASHYVLGLQQQLGQLGLASVAMNLRGCSGEPNLLPRSYHSGASDDLAQVITQLQHSHPQRKLYAVGYSLGGNILLKHLGESAEQCGLSGAVAVSVPFRLDHCAERIGEGFSKVYQKHFIDGLIRYTLDKKARFNRDQQLAHLETLDALGPATGIRTFWEFDERYTAPLNGYSSAADYYQRASSRFFLGQIRVPTLLIQAEDDPFIYRHSLPEPHELSSSTQFELHKNGGHVGFVGGSPRQPHYYLEHRISQWLSSQTP